MLFHFHPSTSCVITKFPASKRIEVEDVARASEQYAVGRLLPGKCHSRRWATEAKSSENGPSRAKRFGRKRTSLPFSAKCSVNAIGPV